MTSPTVTLVVHGEDFCLISSARLPPVTSRGDTITLKEASRLGFILPSEVHTVRRITDAAFHAAANAGHP